MNEIAKQAVDGANGLKNHSTIIDAILVVNEALEAGVKAQKFLVAVWIVDEEGKLFLQTRTTWRFPLALFPEAMNLLQEKIDEELTLKKPEPLPVADILTPEKRAGWEPIPETAFEKEEDTCDD